jgi:hypothetical protein
MLFSETSPVYFENPMELQKYSVSKLQRFLAMKAGGVYSYHCPFNNLPACLYYGIGSETAVAVL